MNRFDAFYYTYTDGVHEHEETRLRWFKVELREETQALVSTQLIWVDVDQIESSHWNKYKHSYLHLFKRLAKLEPMAIEVLSHHQLETHVHDTQLHLGKVKTTII